MPHAGPIRMRWSVKPFPAVKPWVALGLLLLLSACAGPGGVRGPAPGLASACTALQTLGAVTLPPGLGRWRQEQLDTCPSGGRPSATAPTLSGAASAPDTAALTRAITRLPALQPDARFQALAAMVDGSPALAGQTFPHQLAGYLLRPDYACVHPGYAAYFARRFGGALNYDQCATDVPFYLFDPQQGGRVVSIDPQRVHQIHILFATGGESLVSGFGHVALRLVVCPPGDNAAGACDQNLAQHVVLGYMAQVNGWRVDTWRGITGGYAARLMGMTFMEAYRNNTLLEDRDLYSLPLRLSRPQIEQMVRELAEVHWSYRGRYEFFTNNCATLLQDTLATLLSDAGQLADPVTGYRRPDRFFQALRRSPWVESQWLHSLPRAEALGYYFPSNRGYFQRARTLVASASEPDRELPTLEQYPALPAPVRLRQALADPALVTAMSRHSRVVEAQILLEEYALLQQEKALSRQVAAWFANGDVGTQLTALEQTLADPGERTFLRHCYVQPLRLLRQGLPRSEGIPADPAVGAVPGTVDCGHWLSRLRLAAALGRHLQHDEDYRALQQLGQEMRLTLKNIAQLRTLL